MEFEKVLGTDRSMVDRLGKRGRNPAAESSRILLKPIRLSRGCGLFTSPLGSICYSYLALYL
eukprot:1763948-Pleurochrysis_carterae.AAC.1